MVDQGDDGFERGSPPSPDDRLWRHPSEVTAVASARVSPAEGVHRRRRRVMVGVAVISSITAAAATVVCLAALGYLSPRVVERVEQGAASRPVATGTTVRSARVVATDVAPAVVEIVARTGSERRQGSGVVLRSEGVIASSADLIEGASTVTVRWPSGRAETAEVRGTDPLSGLAALVVAGSTSDVDGLNTTTVRPGAVAITVGASSEPQGPALVQGHVSATGAHAEPDTGELLGLIETDQPVPDWADGGALLDGDGALVGVSLAVPEQHATGWAVPMEVVTRVIDDLTRLGRCDRGWLGIRGTATDAEGSRPSGLRVEDVESESPAWGAGLRDGDLIVSVAGRPVESLADVQAALVLTRPGDDIVIGTSGPGGTDRRTVTLGRYPG